MKYFYKLFFILLFISGIGYGQINLDTVKAKRFDTGKMWTFDNPPVQYLKETYGFTPDENWFENVRLSALKYAYWCSASFVSEDGLIMTNHHCAEGAKSQVKKDGEDLVHEGFYAKTLEEERKVPGLFIEQLVFLEDVTDRVHDAINKGESDEEKIKNKLEEIKNIEKEYKEETDLNCRVISLYNGGKYSVYGTKRYNDIRLVFIPEEQVAYFGGDFDNFTYPRYNLDCAFLRAYDENGKPLKTDHFFRFSHKEPTEDEVIFTVGNPGRTERLKTVAQLEYNRDLSTKVRSFILNKIYYSMDELKAKYPERAKEFDNMKAMIGNGQKVYNYIYEALIDPYFIARKRAFENEFKSKVKSNPKLNEKYGNVWDAIESTREELKEYDSKIMAFDFLNRRTGAAYFKRAERALNILNSEKFNKDSISSYIKEISSIKIDPVFDSLKLNVQLHVMEMTMGNDNNIVEQVLADNNFNEATHNLITSSLLTDSLKLVKLFNSGKESIMKDPFMNLLTETKEELAEAKELSEEINNTEDVYEDLLGRALFEVYGTTIPPDANFTLRISDGTLKSFDYNGTKAAVNTTFYGLYNRYYGNKGKYPWNLHKRWIERKDSLNLETPFNFISTNDIVGGNSGSPIINKNAEIVGLAFDGNIQSIKGNFIYMPKDNRCVGVSALGMMEAIKNVYKAERLYNELFNGKIK